MNADGVLYDPGHPPPRIHLIPFDTIEVGTEPAYLIKGLIPRVGLTVVWGPPKSGKSFWTFDAVMHAALGWEYRGRRVQAGPVVYVAAEGATGLRARIAAFRQERIGDAHSGAVPFYLVPVNLDLIGEHRQLIAAIREAGFGSTCAEINGIGGTSCLTCPAVVVIDTLNRTLRGSESSDEDMSAYIAAADAIREAFSCAVVVVHHCGVDASRPRGHTSLGGAVDAQIAIKRDRGENIIATVEWMKDGPEGDALTSRLVSVEVGTDDDGDAITSCVVEPAEDAAPAADTGPRLTRNQTTLFTLLYDAGHIGLAVEEWNERAREVGIGVKRNADLYDIRQALKRKGLVYESAGVWQAKR